MACFTLKQLLHMTAFTNYLKSNLLNHIFSATPYTKPNEVYVGLITAVTNIATGSVTEPSANGYARVKMSSTVQTPENMYDGNWVNNGTGIISNGVVVQFPAATGAWGTCTHFALWDKATGAASPNLLVCAPLTTLRNITTGTAPKFEIGTLQIQMS